jgi:membrane fusion protein (multidrug efflux system)
MRRTAILAFIVTVLLSSGCKEEHEKQKESTFRVITPIEKDTIIFHEYVCQIHSISHIELRSQERGYLQSIYVDEGQLVKKGQLLFQIMPLMYQAEAHRSEAEAAYVELEYQNTKRLADSNIVSQNELALAKARLDKAKAELSLALAHLGFTNIRAPFDGIMGRFYVRLGSLIDEGELLSTLSDNNKMWVYFNIPEAEYLEYATRVKSDDLMKVKLKMANNQLFPFPGTVETIEADFNNETGNIAFRATFPNPGAVLRHGETGNILMPAFHKNALLIPQKATFEILDRKYVFVVDEHNMVRSREITVGEELPHLFLVSSGITTKDRILLEGLRKVKNNQEIHYEMVSFNTVLSELNQLHSE